MEIIAHRGASHDAPENTLSAFRLGYEQGADAVELDVQLTGDDRVIALHDEDTRRTAGISRRVAAHSLTELSKLEIGQWGKWRGSKFSERIPLLEDVFAIVPTGKRLFVELKAGLEMLAPLRRLVQDCSMDAGQLVLIGFDRELMRQAKSEMPQAECCWIVGRSRTTRAYPSVRKLIDGACAARLDGLNLEAGFPIDTEFVGKIHRSGLKLNTWTVDKVNVAQTEKAAGVDGITTNRPGWMRQALRTTR